MGVPLQPRRLRLYIIVYLCRRMNYMRRKRVSPGSGAI